jgi:drug/metabolite transporter (DMT)-like permease
MASSTSQGTHRAGLFDIRMIIGLLLGIYGVVLVVTSFFTSQEQLDKADGVDVNLWTGIGLLVAAAVFAVWTRLRPIVVPEDPEDDSAGQDRQGHPG